MQRIVIKNRVHKRMVQIKNFYKTGSFLHQENFILNVILTFILSVNLDLDDDLEIIPDLVEF